MNRALNPISATLLSLCYTAVLLAQPTVPRLVKFSGALASANGRPLTGTVGVTFALYENQEGGAPLWMETQNVQADSTGHYTATLGSTRNEGIPADVFASGQGRWLGVEPQGELERPRVLMTSVPYALKAVDAETLGGLPASAFALAGTPGAASGHSGSSIASPRTPDTRPQTAPDTTVGGTGTANHLAYWSNSTTLGSSVLYQSASKKVGLGTTTPTTAFDVQTAATTAILGNATATSGSFNGVNGQTSSTGGQGVSGIATATSGSATGVYAQTSSPAGNALFAINNATSGYAFGIQGFSNSPSGVAIQGNATAPSGSAVTGINSGTTGGAGVIGSSNATSGFGVGVNGSSNSPGGAGVFGINSAATGGNGVQGQSNASSGGNGVYGWTAGTGNGVLGVNGDTSGFAVGVNGQTASPQGNGVNGLNVAANGGNGVFGISNATTGFANGVDGQSASTSGNGVFGVNTATSGFANGVNGQSSSPQGNGVNGVNMAATGGNGGTFTSNATSGGGNGVYGQTSSTGGNGMFGTNLATSGFAVGVNGQTASPQGTGVNGLNTATTGGNGGNFTSNATSGYANGVYGQSSSTNGNGVAGNATATSGFAIGVSGATNSPNGAGVFGLNNAASGGFGLDGQAGANGIAMYAVNQTCGSSGCTLVAGTAGEFVTGAGGLVIQGFGGAYGNQVFHVDSGGNGFFKGNLTVNGTVSKGGGSFKIDHPLDPENKYLSHSFVESPDMKDVYDGVVRLDARGEAWVNLPDYFEALNGDFRYQLTAIGAPAPRLYVAREVSANRFKIAGGRPGGKVSWQVTGTRHDAYANAHRIPVSEDKPASEQGRYLHPDAYGQQEGAQNGGGSR